MCDSRLCNDSQARCAVTIFSVLLVLFLVSCLCLLALALARPCPCSPSPSLALALALARPCPRSPSPSPLPILALTARPCLHRSSPPSPSAITAVSSRQCADVQRQHTSIYASPGPHLRVLKSLGSRPLSLPLLSPGEHPQTQHAGTVLHYTAVPSL